jgi:hypothetical protein
MKTALNLIGLIIGSAYFLALLVILADLFKFGV